MTFPLRSILKSSMPQKTLMRTLFQCKAKPYAASSVSRSLATTTTTNSTQKTVDDFQFRYANGQYIGPWSDEKQGTTRDGMEWVEKSIKKLKFMRKLATTAEKAEAALPYDIGEQILRESVVAVDTKAMSSSNPHFTWIGHSTVSFQVDGVHFITDPVWSQRASPFSFMGPKRYVDPPIEVEDLPIDVVLLSHTHYDHLDEATARRIGNRALWLVPLGVKDVLAKFGITNCVELAWWEEYQLQKTSKLDTKVCFTPAKHWTARTFFDRNTSLWGSFCVIGQNQRVYFAGDTAYDDALFKVIGDRHGPFDLSLIPIGAYKPRNFMKANHNDPYEAVLIHRDLQSKQSLAIHWGTFPLATDGAIEAALELGRARELLNVDTNEIFTLAHGQTMTFGDIPKTDFCLLHPDAANDYSLEVDAEEAKGATLSGTENAVIRTNTNI